MPYHPEGKILCWWSGGVTSAVAIKMALEKYGPNELEIYFFETGSHHPDTYRFMDDCQRWYGKEIHWLQNRKYKNVDHVIYDQRYINGPKGAKCTQVLKKDMRIYVESARNFRAQIFGFDYGDAQELERARRFALEWEYTRPEFPLIERFISKPNAVYMLNQVGIDEPMMYKLGYHNNNCIGCVKGGMGYFNRIRRDFPHEFKKKAKLERYLGRSCIKDVFLDELDPEAGRHDPPIVGECGIFCPVEMMGWQEPKEEVISE